MEKVQISSSWRQILRRRTAHDHARAELQHWTDAGFVDETAYVRYLKVLYQAHLGFGAPAARIRGDASEQRYHQTHADLLAADLGYGARPRVDPADMSSRDEAWGVSYALIGSALGATVILKKTGREPNWPTRYLTASASFAKSGGVRRFFEQLDAAQPDLDAATRGAQRVFEVIETGGVPADTSNRRRLVGIL